MFDISWIEMLFVAVLGLVIIGPKDLPKVFQTVAKTIAKAKRTINDVKGSIVQLEREVDIDAGKVSASDDWRELLPKEVRDLPDDFIPGSLPASHHHNRKQALAKAQSHHSSVVEPSTQPHASSNVNVHNEKHPSHNINAEEKREQAR